MRFYIKSDRKACMYHSLRCLRTPGWHGHGQIEFVPIETLIGSLRSTTYAILKKSGQKGMYHPMRCLRAPGWQGQGQIEFVPIETLFGALRSTTYAILKKIGQKGIFPLLWSGVL